MTLRILYICLGYCLAPIAFGVVLWRGLRDRSYWQALGERFGFGTRLAPGGLWVHAVSVGEVQAAVALVRQLRARHPRLPLVLTTATPTGRSRAERLFGADVTVRYLPYDLPDAVARFLARIRPRLAVILETELWPNLYRGCGRRGIPIVLASARLSARSVGRYRRLGALIRATLAGDVAIAAQSESDKQRFVAIGANPARSHVVGNIKCDFELPADVMRQGAALREMLGVERPVWVAGSTHAGEEEQLLDAQRALDGLLPGALLVLVPRHPQRFESVAALLRRRRISFVTRSSGTPVGAATSVLLVDTLGELVEFYAAGDVAFVGGSLVAVGGHNLLEPAALAKPILSGPHTFNTASSARLLAEEGALELVPDAGTLAERLAALLVDPAARARAGGQGLAALTANRGALGRLVRLIDSILGPGEAA
ncbi:MAG TPA: lipid IV(A) 3-deoxy-D-manno-octulosonic acid transferase [Steroidobacteraceae bacterium]|nr:lipid IV(A) 3-deoxy-D-manno-octulosonic acid transferase [Steroidobacteraceae bacterium]